MNETERSYQTMNFLNCFPNNKKGKYGLNSIQKDHQLNMNSNNNANQNNNKKSTIKNNKTSKAHYFSSEKKKKLPSRIAPNQNPNNNNMTIPARIKLFRTTTNFYKNNNIKIKKNINDLKNKNNEEEKNANINSEYYIENDKFIKNLEIEQYIFRNTHKIINEFNLMNNKKVTKKNNYLNNEINSNACKNYKVQKSKNTKKSIIKFQTKENNNKKYYNNQLPLLNKINNNKNKLHLKGMTNEELISEKSIKPFFPNNKNDIDNNNSNKENKENNNILYERKNNNNNNNNIISYNYKFRHKNLFSSFNKNNEIINKYYNNIGNKKVNEQINNTNSNFGNNNIVFNQSNSKIRQKKVNSKSFNKLFVNDKMKVGSNSKNMIVKYDKNDIDLNNDKISKNTHFFKNYTSTNFFMAHKKRINSNDINEVKYSSNVKKRFLKLGTNLKDNDNNLLLNKYTNILNSDVVTNNKKDKLEKYNIGKILGKGAYATVKLIKDKLTNEKYAMKIYEKSKLNSNLKKKCVYKEIEIMKRVNHKNIVKLIDVIHTETQILIIQEYIKGMSLREYYNEEIKNQKGISDHKVKIFKKIFKQIFEAMNYLHCNYMAHRDIKLENILITKEYEIKIIDFGFGMLNPENKIQYFFCGTPNYMSPEIIDKKGYIGQKSDLWSLGVLIYKIYCADFPFKGKNEKELFKAIKRSEYYIIDYVPENVKKIIKGLIVYEPNKRLTCKEILKSEWLKN